MKMITRLIAKKDTQQMIKALRSAGLVVNKDSLGLYRCVITKKTDGGDLTTKLFTAMPGRSGYLVNMRADLFEAQA
jgi:hypothetical protein